MISTKTNCNMLSLLYKPLCVVLLLFGLFGLIWLRSSIVTVAYDLRKLEEKKMDSLRDRKTLLAERAQLMSLEKIAASFQQNVHRDSRPADAETNIFGDRVKVVHVRRNKQTGPMQASLRMGSKN